MCGWSIPTTPSTSSRWLAHRVQRPHEKINHALVLGGEQGIGKDTLLEPVKHAVGPWNFRRCRRNRCSAASTASSKSVILRISEARDLGEFDRFKFYDHMKAYTAAPPDVLRVDEKNLREYAILNVCGVIITTNHKTDGIYLPADDRRHYVAWSDLTKEDERFAGRLLAADLWLLRGRRDGSRRRLPAQLDISALRSEGAAAEDRGLLGNRRRQPRARGGRARRRARPDRQPRGRHARDADHQAETQHAATASFADWLKDRKNRRDHPAPVGRVRLRAGAQPRRRGRPVEDQGKRQAVYAKENPAFRDRIAGRPGDARPGRSSQCNQ